MGAPTAVPCAPWTSPRLRTSSGRRRDDCPQQQKRRKEGRKEEEGSKGGRKESDAGHSLFELAPCALRRLRCALCRARAGKRGEKKKKKMKKKKKRKKETGEFRWLLRDGGSNGFWCRRPRDDNDNGFGATVRYAPVVTEARYRKNALNDYFFASYSWDF